MVYSGNLTVWLQKILCKIRFNQCDVIGVLMCLPSYMSDQQKWLLLNEFGKSSWAVRCAKNDIELL